MSGSSELHRRKPFQYGKDISEIDDETSERILDEQEQEQIIDDLSAEVDRSAALNNWLSLVTLGVSFFLQTVYFIGLHLDKAHSRFPTFIASFFTLLNLVLHTHALLDVYNRMVGLKTKLPALLPIQLLVLVAPATAVINETTRPEALWCLIPAGATAVAWLCKKWNEDGEQAIKDLEKLKYNMKGA